MSLIIDCIIAEIIQEEKKKEKLEKSGYYRDNAVLHIEVPYEDPREEETEEKESNRGVITIEI